MASKFCVEGVIGDSDTAAIATYANTPNPAQIDTAITIRLAACDMGTLVLLVNCPNQVNAWRRASKFCHTAQLAASSFCDQRDGRVTWELFLTLCRLTPYRVTPYDEARA